MLIKNENTPDTECIELPLPHNLFPKHTQQSVINKILFHLFIDKGQKNFLKPFQINPNIIKFS